MDLGRGTYLDRGACVEKIIKKGREGRGHFFGKISLWKLDREMTSGVRIGTPKQPKHPEATQPRHDGVGPKR